MANRNTSCSFCRKDYREVGPLVEGPGEVYICGNCVELCRSILRPDDCPEVIRDFIAPQALDPRMLQAMEVLQLPIMALQERIQQELRENPVLEMGDTPMDDLTAGEEENEFQDPKTDIVVERTAEGDYTVRLTDDWPPNIYISRRYLELCRDKQADPKTKEYLKRKLQAAQWLLESIEQRRDTLERVTRAILQYQRAFLDKGPDHIEPLKMQQIADQVGVHITTVSRAVDGKWLQTPHGLFPLRCFFAGPGNMNDV
jgi:DNA-directed RNA polymerase specialized sigma54-like protein